MWYLIVGLIVGICIFLPTLFFDILALFSNVVQEWLLRTWGDPEPPICVAAFVTGLFAIFIWPIVILIGAMLVVGRIIGPQIDNIVNFYTITRKD